MRSLGVLGRPPVNAASQSLGHHWYRPDVQSQEHCTACMRYVFAVPYRTCSLLPSAEEWMLDKDT